MRITHIKTAPSGILFPKELIIFKKKGCSVLCCTGQPREPLGDGKASLYGCPMLREIEVNIG